MKTYDDVLHEREQQAKHAMLAERQESQQSRKRIIPNRGNSKESACKSHK